jgi:hypothetical protein
VLSERDRGNEFGELDSRRSGSAHGPSPDKGPGIPLDTGLRTATRGSPVLTVGGLRPAGSLPWLAADHVDNYRRDGVALYRRRPLQTSTFRPK